MEVEAQPLQFNLEAYANNYTGHAKIDRLLFISKAPTGQDLELQALKLAVDELKNTDNTALYRDIINRISTRSGPEYSYDSAWVDDIDRRFIQKQETLDSELTVARSTLVKESIREGHARFGDLLYSRGEIVEAFRQYLRTRDYCTTPQQTVEMCINVVKCALEMKNYLHVNTYVQKAEAFPTGAIDPEALGKLRAAQGVAYLAQGKYEPAAKSFTSLPADLGSSFANVLSAGDVATYGTLCALATMDRREVSLRVVNSGTFRDLLNQAPVEVRDAANDYFGSRYGTALMALERLRPVLMLDPYMADHVEALLSAVRAQAVTQYTRPFTTLDLVAMASAFHTDEASLEQELVTLIASKQISGRIDTHSKALLSHKEDARSATYRAAITAAEHYLRSTKTMLLRAGMMRFDLIRRPAAGERPDRPERPERGEGPRSGALPRGERGEGSGRRHHRGGGGGGGGGEGKSQKDRGGAGSGSRSRHDNDAAKPNTSVSMLAE